MKFLLLLSLLVSVNSQAKIPATPPEACPTLDLRETFPLAMRDQHHVSWCFAFAASDALQYTFQIPETISAADIAINYSRSKWSRFIHIFKRLTSRAARLEPAQTGLIKYAAQMIIPQGYCPETVFPSEEWSRVGKNGELKKVQVLDAAVEIFALQKNVRNGTYRSASELPFFYEFKNLDHEQFFSLLRGYKRDSLLNALRNRVCLNERKPFPGTASVNMKFTSKKILKQINASFDERRPMTIDFFNRVFQDIDKPLDILHGYHTVLLYGRKYDTERNECRYLLKNSAGSSCESYDPRLQCEAGYVWMPESTLKRTMTSAVFFKHN